MIGSNPANNVYPITFTDNDQEIIRLHFDTTITASGPASAYTVNGTVQSISFVMIGAFWDGVSTDLIIGLTDGINYGESSSITVTYAKPGVGPVLTGTGGDVDSFGPIAAVNNYEVTCEDIIAYATIETYGEICKKFYFDISGRF